MYKKLSGDSLVRLSSCVLHLFVLDVVGCDDSQQMANNLFLSWCEFNNLLITDRVWRLYADLLLENIDKLSTSALQNFICLLFKNVQTLIYCWPNRLFRRTE